MNTATMAALSCALLGHVLMTPHALAGQCEEGQAHMSLKNHGHIEESRVPGMMAAGTSSERYRLEILANPTMDFADVPSDQAVASMSAYLVIGSNAPVSLPYRSKVNSPISCLEYAAWRVVHPSGEVVLRVNGAYSNIDPLLCFAKSGDAEFILDFEINSSSMINADKLRSSDIRVYIQGKRTSDGPYLTLFDTRTPCGQ